MAKEPSRGEKKRTSSPGASRGQIDRLDRELVKLLNLRAKLAIRLADHEGRVQTISHAEIDQLHLRLAELNKGPLTNESLRSIYLELISAINHLRKPRKVAFLGPFYSYSHVATLKYFGTSCEMLPVGTIASVFEEVMRGHAPFGVVPLENSTDGRIADTLDMFTRLPVKICGEVPLEIHHCLLGRCDRTEVAEVYSKPQALSQCRHWLGKHLAGARLVEVTSTTVAAELARDKQGAAAIASVQAGVHYGLNVLAENIEDNNGNVTRFVVIGEQMAERTGRDRTLLMFEVEHRPGGLADAINVFKKNRLNMTWIESFPIAGSDGRYMFFIEFDGHPTDAKAKKAIESLERRCLRLDVLGACPRGVPLT